MLIGNGGCRHLIVIGHLAGTVGAQTGAEVLGGHGAAGKGEEMESGDRPTSCTVYIRRAKPFQGLIGRHFLLGSSHKLGN